MTTWPCKVPRLITNPLWRGNLGGLIGIGGEPRCDSRTSASPGPCSNGCILATEPTNNTDYERRILTQRDPVRFEFSLEIGARFHGRARSFRHDGDQECRSTAIF